MKTDKVCADKKKTEVQWCWDKTEFDKAVDRLSDLLWFIADEFGNPKLKTSDVYRQQKEIDQEMKAIQRSLLSVWTQLTLGIDLALPFETHVYPRDWHSGDNKAADGKERIWSPLAIPELFRSCDLAGGEVLLEFLLNRKLLTLRRRSWWSSPETMSGKQRLNVAKTLLIGFHILRSARQCVWTSRTLIEEARMERKARLNCFSV